MWSLQPSRSRPPQSRICSGRGFLKAELTFGCSASGRKREKKHYINMGAHSEGEWPALCSMSGHVATEPCAHTGSATHDCASLQNYTDLNSL